MDVDVDGCGWMWMWMWMLDVARERKQEGVNKLD